MFFREGRLNFLPHLQVFPTAVATRKEEEDLLAQYNTYIQERASRALVGGTLGGGFTGQSLVIVEHWLIFSALLLLRFIKVPTKSTDTPDKIAQIARQTRRYRFASVAVALLIPFVCTSVSLLRSGLQCVSDLEEKDYPVAHELRFMYV